MHSTHYLVYFAVIFQVVSSKIARINYRYYNTTIVKSFTIK
jgi:hypothetical protein